MLYERVIARAYKGEPVVRELIHSNERVAYLANPEFLEAVEAGLSIPIGFPLEDIYCFESDVYVDIRTEWAQQGAVSADGWNRLRKKFI